MQYRLLVTALAGSAFAFPPFPLRARQGVPERIAPTAATPSGYVDTLPGTFGIAVMNISTAGGSPATMGTPEDYTQFVEYVILASPSLLLY